MKIISQDGRKAIDSTEISYFYITKDKSWELIVMPKGQTGECPWSTLILFRHSNEKVVTTMLKYLQILMVNGFKRIIKVDIPTFYSYGMKEFAPELLEESLETDFEKSNKSSSGRVEEHT